MTPDRYYVAFEAWGMVTLWKGPRDCAMGTLRCASSVPALGEAVSHSYISQWGQEGCWSAEVGITVYIQQITALALLCRNGLQPSPSPS